MKGLKIEFFFYESCLCTKHFKEIKFSLVAHAKFGWAFLLSNYLLQAKILYFLTLKTSGKNLAKCLNTLL